MSGWRRTEKSRSPAVRADAPRKLATQKGDEGGLQYAENRRAADRLAASVTNDCNPRNYGAEAGSYRRRVTNGETSLDAAEARIPK